MTYGLFALAIALILSLPACGMFRKNTDTTVETTAQLSEPMPVEVEEVEVTETVVPDDMSGSEADSDMSNQDAA